MWRADDVGIIGTGYQCAAVFPRLVVGKVVCSINAEVEGGRAFHDVLLLALLAKERVLVMQGSLPRPPYEVGSFMSQK